MSGTNMTEAIENEMSQTPDSENGDADLDSLLNKYFKGRVVRKDLTKLIKEGANVPVYVIEYLLCIYCAYDDS